MEQYNGTPLDEISDPSEELLRKLYVEKQLSQRAVAEKLDCSRTVVKDRLKEYSINKRGMSEAATIRSSRNPAKFRIMDHGYEAWDTHIDGEWPTVLVHRLAAVAWFGYDAVVDNVVHHENGFKRDNREENFDLMSNSSHSKHHSNEGEVGFAKVGNQYSDPPS